MAVIAVLVGQCGNQLGDELFTQLALCTGTGGAAASSSSSKQAAPTAAPSPFFTRDGKARCILIDTEPKVVLGVQKRHPDFIRPENIIHGQSGRGNNWGLGYHGVKTAWSKRTEENAAVQRAFRNIARDQRMEDDNVLGKALQAIYHETRRTSDAADDDDRLEAILVLHSLVGGTGSGLASKLTERLRLYFTDPLPGGQVDEVYESKMMQHDGFDGGLYGPQRRARHLVNITIAPLSLGEVATRGLNAALTLHILQRHADAVVLLRNDDAMAPGDASGSSVCTGDSLLPRCVTFKEANEILIALLMPVLHYGLRCGCITELLCQCVPPGYTRTTGGNKILTILATPQRSYAAVRQCAHRAMFYPVSGGRAFMPGYVPTVPVGDLLSRTALRLAGAGGEETWGGVSRRGPPAAQRVPGKGGLANRPSRLPDLTKRNSRQRGSAGEGEVNAGWCSGAGTATAAASIDATASSGRQGQRASPFAGSPQPSSSRPARSRVPSGRFNSSDDENEDEELVKRVYAVSPTTIPATLYRHYLQLRRAPVTKLFEALDGVLVLNEAHELNRRVLFPLLQSAALKVSTGAFMSCYEDVGVKADRVQKAYREMAEVMTTAEEL